MPPTFFYIMALFAYGACAGAFWLGCILLALVPRTRRPAWRAALSMAATFPGVFLAQAVATPFVVAWLAVGLLGVRLIEAGATSESSLAIALATVTALGAFGTFAFASLYGFYVGWTVMWRRSGGAPTESALRAHRLLSWALDTYAGRIAWRMTCEIGRAW